jgi:hypothetical protein
MLGEFSPVYAAWGCYIDGMDDEGELAMAVRHVREGPERIRRQIELVARRERAGQDTAASEWLLEGIRTVFEWHGWHLAQIIAERGDHPEPSLATLPKLTDFELGDDDSKRNRPGPGGEDDSGGKQ